MNADVRSYRDDQKEPQLYFNEARTLIDEIKEIMKSADEPLLEAYTNFDEPLLEAYTNFTSESMARAIFGSNMQEEAGLSHEQTYRLCMRIFNGEDIDPAAVEERSEEYAASIRFLQQQRGLMKPSQEDVVRSRREVIQHAQAMSYLANAALNCDQPLSGELIKETHRILCQGLPIEKKHGENWAGNYRKLEAQVKTVGGFINFCVPEEIEQRMSDFVDSFNNDVRDKEESGMLDPFYLAADVCQDFVGIHPFPDGNGRMCRLLLNAYLIKYAGVVVPIGETAESRQEYMDLVIKTNDETLEEEARGNLGRLVLGRAVTTLRRLRDTIR